MMALKTTLHDDPMTAYALWRAFAAFMDSHAAAVGDEDELPAPKKDVEAALFLSFGGVTTKEQYLDLKSLLLELGSFIRLSSEDRRSIASLATYKSARAGADANTAAALEALRRPLVEHYQGVLARSIRSTIEMKDKVEAFVAYHKLAERFGA